MTAKNNKLPFLTAQARMKSRYGITMPRDSFIEKAYYVWRSIGNIARDEKIMDTEVPSDRKIPLPSGCEFLDSVTSEVSNTGVGDGFDSSGYKASSSSEDNTVDYRLEDDYIIINDDRMVGYPVRIRYSSILTDDDGLPMLNDKEVEAIAANVAMQKAEIDLFSGVATAGEILKYIKPEAVRLLQAAGMDEKLSEDDLDKILNIKASWEQKTYGNRLKFR
jgi:hypothetical protein